MKRVDNPQLMQCNQHHNSVSDCQSIIPCLYKILNHQTILNIEPVIRMSSVKMMVGSKYSQISLGLIGKLLFLPCYSNKRQNFKNLQGILKFCYSIWYI